MGLQTEVDLCHQIKPRQEVFSVQTEETVLAQLVPLEVLVWKLGL